MAESVFEQIVPTQKTQPRWLREVKRNIPAYLFLLPAILLFIYFLWYPILQSFVISFQDIGMRWENPDWVGLENFRVLFANPLFWKSWQNTLFYTLIALLFGYVVPVALAISVNEMGRSRDYFRLAFYLPGVLPGMVTIVMWRWFFYPTEGGLVNMTLSLFGIDPLPWLNSPSTAMWAILIMTTWAGAGGAMMIYLAALQGIPAHLYDAAEIDGASIWQRMIHISVPQIRYIMLLTLVGQIVGTVQIFNEPFVMTGGGPVNATYTVALLQYDYAFRYVKYGIASALGLVIFVVLAGFSLFYTRMMIFSPQAKEQRR